MKKLFFIISFIIAFVVLVYGNQLAYTKDIRTINECIYNSPDVQNIELNQQNNVVFKIHYIANSPSNCINPNFPSIHIVSNGNYNAWIHIVTTNSKDLKYKRYIDANEKSFPFYSIDKNFYDAPLWGNYFFNISMSHWNGNAYPVIVDRNKKIVILKRGVKWGYRLKNFSKPKIIKPRNLTISESMDDMIFLQKEVKDFKFYYWINNNYLLLFQF